MLLALHDLLDILAPAESAPIVGALLSSITSDPVLCVLIAAGLTWVAHSSVATVLLVMSLAYSQFITPPAALALVLVPISAVLSTLKADAGTIRPAIGCRRGTYSIAYPVSNFGDARRRPA
jgi:Na+/phosphate symporter